MRVAIPTDNDFGKVNGVTTTLRAVLANAPDDVHVRVHTAASLASDAAARLPPQPCRSPTGADSWPELG